MTAKSEMTQIALRVNQTWKPTNGERARQIWNIREANPADRGRPTGSTLICWAARADRNGTCSEKAFRAWIKRNSADLQEGIQ